MKWGNNVKGSEASGHWTTVWNARFKRDVDKVMLHHTAPRNRLVSSFCEALEAQSGRALQSGRMSPIPFLDGVRSKLARKNPPKPPLQDRCGVHD